MLTKSEQLKKNRIPNPKKMIDVEYKCYVDFVNDRAGYSCQLCGAPAQDIHHSEFGKDKDDRSIIAICRNCHSLIRYASPKDIESGSRLKYRAKTIGKENWRAYVEI